MNTDVRLIDPHSNHDMPTRSSFTEPSNTGSSNDPLSTNHATPKETQRRPSYYATIEKLELMSANFAKFGERLDKITAMCDEYLQSA